MSLHHLAYVSQALSAVGPELLKNILDTSVRNNKRDGITGVLLYHDEMFFQVLEGPKSAVQHCFARILRDRRHANVSRMWDSPVEHRVFSDWLMGYAGPDEVGQYSFDNLEFLSDLASDECLKKGSGGVALQLARQFFEDFKERA